MSSFTEDDLKRIKRIMATNAIHVATIQNDCGTAFFALEALVARLEAAEKCIPQLEEAEKSICDETGSRYKEPEYITVWKKSKGE